MKRGYLLLVMVMVLAVPLVAQEIPVPADPPASVAVAPVFAPDNHPVQPAAAPEQPWQIITRMGAQERLHATLSVTTDPSAPEAAKSLATQAASAWNAGDEKTAAQALYDLGRLIDPSGIELCLNWHDVTPVPGSNLLSANVRVGTLDSVAAVSLAANADATLLYAVVSHASLGGSLHLYQSIDKGATWTPTVTITGIGGAPAFALAPLNASLYIGYLPGGSSTFLRLRKFRMDTGTVDSLAGGGFSRSVITMAAGDTVRDVVGSSNILTLNNRMYFSLRTHNRKARVFWSAPTSDTTWAEVLDSSATGVLRGLSLAYARGNGVHRLYVSYVDSLNRVCIDTSSLNGTFFKRAMTASNAGTGTSISAHGDTVLCVYDYSSPTISSSRYFISYTRGASWLTGAPIDSTVTAETGTAMLEKGQGMVIFYRHYLATTREGRVLFRTYSNANSWSTAENITDYSPHYWRYGIAALGGNTWGVLYITYNFQLALRAVVFATFTRVPTDVQTEEPSAPSSYALLQNFPNPFNPSTEIAYDLPKSQHVTLTVYDVLGKQVAVLVNGVQQAGQQTARWNASAVSSGVYYYRLQAGDFSAVKKMVLMK